MDATRAAIRRNAVPTVTPPNRERTKIVTASVRTTATTHAWEDHVSRAIQSLTAQSWLVKILTGLAPSTRKNAVRAAKASQSTPDVILMYRSTIIVILWSASMVNQGFAHNTEGTLMVVAKPAFENLTFCAGFDANLFYSPSNYPGQIGIRKLVLFIIKRLVKFSG